jgi:hypothetical protein
METPLRMRTSLVVYSVCNVIGMVLVAGFIWSLGHQARMEEREIDSVDGVTFFCEVMPVYAVCILVNVGLTIHALVDLFRRRGYGTLITLAGIVAAWVLFVMVERSLPAA